MFRTSRTKWLRYAACLQILNANSLRVFFLLVFADKGVIKLTVSLQAFFFCSGVDVVIVVVQSFVLELFNMRGPVSRGVGRGGGVGVTAAQ